MARRADRIPPTAASEASSREAIAPRRSPRFWPFLLGVLLVLLGLAGAWQRGWILAPEISVPEQLDQLEPDVRQLVMQHVERVRLSPRDASLHAELGLVYEANELWREARAAFATAVALDPQNPDWRLHLAISSFDAGDAELSTQLLAQLVKDAPQLAPAQHRYGQAMLAAGQLEDAEKAFQAALELAPQSPEALTGLADVRLRQNRPREAIDLLQRALPLDKDYRVTHFLLGTAYRQTGQLDLAQRELQLGQQSQVRYILDEHTRRTEHFAVTARARHARGLKLATAGKFEQAAIVLNAAHRAAPQDVSIINALAGVYMQNRRTADARKLLERALQLDERHGTTYINLASWHLFNGSPAEALVYAKGAVERSPTVSTAHQVHIQSLMRLQRRDDAKAAVQDALQLLPQDAAIQKLAAMLN